MKLLFVSLVVLVAICVQTNYCPKFQDGKTQAACVNYTSTGEGGEKVLSIALRKCATTDSKKAYCPYQGGATADCQAEPTKLPGFSCANGDECTSKTCTKGVCVGFAEKQACNYTSECDINMFCSSNICTKLGKLGASCSATSPCSLGLFCAKGNCTAMGKRKINENVSAPQECETYYANWDEVSMAATCAKAPKSAKTLSDGGWKCVNENCPAEVDGKTTSCQCGFTENQTKTCNKYPGDVDMKPYFDYAAKVASQPVCHYLAGILCAYKTANDMPTEWAKAYTAYSDFTSFSRYAQNPQFIKDTINSDYWKASAKVLGFLL